MNSGCLSFSSFGFALRARSARLPACANSHRRIITRTLGSARSDSRRRVRELPRTAIGHPFEDVEIALRIHAHRMRRDEFRVPVVFLLRIRLARSERAPPGVREFPLAHHHAHAWKRALRLTPARA